MKILLYLPTPGGMTGAPRRLLALACGLRDLGVIPIIATEPGTPLMAAARKAGIESVDLSPVAVLAMRKGALFGGGPLFRLRVALALLRQQLRVRHTLREARADVVWLRASKSIAFAGLGVLLARRPLVWDIDGELPSRGVVRLLHHAGLALARRVVFQHDAAREIFGDRLAQRHAAKLRVLTPGIDMETLGAARDRRAVEPLAEEGRFRVLQVGTLCDRKNQAFLIEALHRLPPAIRQRVELRFVGGTHSAAYERALRDQAAAYGLTAQVHFLGWRDDVHSLMQDSDLLAMPSKSEGVPNTVQEAMVLGLPVLGSDRGGIPDVLIHEKTGWVLPLGDPAPWARTLATIADDTHARAEVAASARSHAEQHFGTDVWSRRYLGILREAVAAEGAPRP